MAVRSWRAWIVIVLSLVCGLPGAHEAPKAGFVTADARGAWVQFVEERTGPPHEGGRREEQGHRDEGAHIRKKGAETIHHKREEASSEKEHGKVFEKEGREKEDDEKEREEEKDREEEEEEEGEEEEFTNVDINVAAMLLGGVIFVMALFSLVNIEDDDVRRYAWKVISNTISIFMAVLFFQGNNQVLMTWAQSLGICSTTIVFINFAHCLIYLAVLFLTIGFVSGVWGESAEGRKDLSEESWTIADAMLVSFEEQVDTSVVRAISRGDHSAKKSVVTDQYNLEVAVVKKKVELERRKRNNKCWSTLMSHMGGFAAIAAGGSMQHSPLFKTGPLMTFLPVLITTGVLMTSFQLSNVMRWRLKAEAKEAGRQGLRAHMVHEFVLEAENEILSLAISFLTVQVVRYAITGQLPNAEGLEEPMLFELGWNHILAIWGCGIAFVSLSVVLARALRLYEKEQGEGEGEVETERMGERFLDVMMNSCAMSFAWCIMWGARWACIRSPILGVSVMSIMGRIMLALMLSMLAFIAVYALDKVDDAMRQDAHCNKTAERTVASMVGAVSVLVGFTWEHSFDGAVTAVAHLNKAFPQASKFTMGIIVFSLLLRPWRRHILRRAIQLEELKESRDEATRGKHCMPVVSSKSTTSNKSATAAPLLNDVPTNPPAQAH